MVIQDITVIHIDWKHLYLTKLYYIRTHTHTQQNSEGESKYGKQIFVFGIGF